MGKTKIKTIDDSEKVEELKKAKPASVKNQSTFGGKKLGRVVFDSEGGARSAQTRGARRGKRDELVEKLKAELGIEEAPANTLKESPSASLRASEPTFEVRSAEEPTAKHLRGEESDVSQAKLLGGGVKKTQAKAKKPGKARPRSKKYQEVIKDLDRTKLYPIEEAVDIVKNLSYSKFDGTLEAHINTTQTDIRGLVSLPYVSGKKLKILAFGKGAESSGADVAGDDSIIEELAKGKINFDLVITTPEWMPKLAKVAKVLGPKGLMPNPKNGTITDDLKKEVENFQQGKTEYETESKAAVIHLALGKLNQPTEELSSNVKTLLSTLGKSRIKKVTLSPTMGPAVRVDLASI